MGGLWSLVPWPRRFFGQEASRQTTRRTTQPYKYPPAEGTNYFGTHFYLGNCKFNSVLPEVFLFGENNDLNYLSSHPVTFPYKPDKKLRATKTLRSLINVQKDSVKIVKTDTADYYTLEFTFDSDVDSSFRILYCVPDDVNPCVITNEFVDDSVCEKWSPLFKHMSGSGQTFSQPDHVIYGSYMSTLNYDPVEGGEYPLVIVMETVGTMSSAHQVQLTVATIDELGENSHTVKVLKQLLCVDGVVYMLQEIYGLENKGKREEDNSSSDEEDEDNEFEDALEEGSECVICFSEVRDTLILPCRHFCICTTCAASLRYQASNCPICRAPFHALLSLTALQEIESQDPDEVCDQQNTTIPGYRGVSLIQALNGYPMEQRQSQAKGVDANVAELDDHDSTQDVEFIDQSSPEQVDFPPIEVPLSPLGNGHPLSLECDLPGTPTRSDEGTRNIAESIKFIHGNSLYENDVASASSKETELSETSSNISAESNTLLFSSKPARDNSRRGPNMRKKFFNANHQRDGQVDVEMGVLCNRSALDQDNTDSC